MKIIYRWVLRSKILLCGLLQKSNEDEGITACRSDAFLTLFFSMQCQMVQWLDESRVNVQQFVDTKKLIRIWSHEYSWSFNLNLIIGIIKIHFRQKPLIWQVIWRPNRIFRFRPIGPELNCFIDNYWKNVSRLDFKVH